MYINKGNISKLKEAAKHCSLQRACFSNDPEENLKIKRAINLWLTTWVEGPIQSVLEDLGVEVEYSKHFMSSNWQEEER